MMTVPVIIVIKKISIKTLNDTSIKKKKKGKNHIETFVLFTVHYLYDVPPRFSFNGRARDLHFFSIKVHRGPPSSIHSLRLLSRAFFFSPHRLFLHSSREKKIK